MPQIEEMFITDPPPARLHRGDHAAGAEEHAGRIHFHDLVPAFQGLVHQRGSGDVADLHGHARGSPGNAGDIRQYIDLAVFAFDGFSQCRPLGFGADIQSPVLCRASSVSDFVRNQLPHVVLHIAQHDRGTLIRENPSGLRTDARGGAGHDRHFALQPFAFLHGFLRFGRYGVSMKPS